MWPVARLVGAQSDGFMGSRRARMRVSLITISAPAARSSVTCSRFARTTAAKEPAFLSARRSRMTLGASNGCVGEEFAGFKSRPRYQEMQVKGLIAGHGGRAFRLFV